MRFWAVFLESVLLRLLYESLAHSLMLDLRDDIFCLFCFVLFVELIRVITVMICLNLSGCVLRFLYTLNTFCFCFCMPF